MDKPSRVGRIIAIGGGKGGVGKSLVSTNLAVALARLGAKVVVLDADLGAPNLHTMFGIMRPPRTVENFLAGHCTSLEDIALPTPIPGLRLIAGAGGALGSANPSFQSKQKLLAQLGKLPADCLLIDVGAGVDLNTIDFFNAADIRLVVMVPEITSLQNGYAFLKFALFRRLQRATASVRSSEKVTAAFGKDVFGIGSAMDKVSTFFSLLEDEVPDLVAHFQLLLAEFNARLVGNMLHRPEDRNALFAMQRMIRDRLGIDVELAAALRQNANIRNSVNSGRPFATNALHTDPDSAEINQLAAKLLHQDLAPIRKLREDFMRAMNRVPLDPNLDKRFQFGLEGIDSSTEPTTDVVSEPRIAAREAGAAGAFSSEFRQLQRVSERIKLYLPIEVNFDRRWYMGQLTEINEGGALITGIRAPDTWREARGALRVVGDPSTASGIAIGMHSSDPESGQLVVRFTDAAAAGRLVAELRRRQSKAAS
jgi:flagellar biosynthesis protein FlhG